MEYFDFFTRIKQWVKEHNTTIEALLASATDNQVTNAVYQGWKKRQNIPSGEFCYKLARYMNVSTDWLISGQEPDSSFDSLIRDLEMLDTESIQSVRILVKKLADAKRGKN